MRALTAIFTLSIGLGLTGCSGLGEESPASGSDSDPERIGSDEAGFAVGEPHGTGSDPMAHISFLASDALNGRDSPSAGLNKAAEYIKTHLATHGLTGPNPADANGPYTQTFTISTFGAAEEGHGHRHGEGEEVGYGVELFEEGFFLDERMSPTAHGALARQYEKAMKAAGKGVAPLEAGALRPLAEMQSGASLAGLTQNVMGKLVGTGAKSNEVILVMAHLDHIGVASGGVVYNGADDNASGSATILSAIPGLVAVKQAGQLNRSVLFLWTAGEEKGLVGAQYFLDHPIAGIGLANIAGVINMDMVARWDDQRLSIIDTNTSGTANYFRNILTSANGTLADPFNSLNRDINSYIDRQDGWVFLNAGEDVLFVFEGLSNPAGGGSLIPEYHATGDDIDKIIADNGGNKPRRVRDLLIEVVKQAANR
jgi:hypothetical protein